MHAELSSSFRHLLAGAQSDTRLHAQVSRMYRILTTPVMRHCMQPKCVFVPGRQKLRNCQKLHIETSSEGCTPKTKRSAPRTQGWRQELIADAACQESAGRHPGKPTSNLKKCNNSSHAPTASTTEVGSIPSQEDKATGPAACRCCSTAEIPAGGIRAPEPKQPGLDRAMGFSECRTCHT